MAQAEGRPAGDFHAWITRMQAVVEQGLTSDVPCGSCTACCRSAQFIHIDPDESDALAAIPRELLFPAPGQPAGHVLLGFDQAGRCPMLVDDACTIYDQRPRTCRMYDCRVFPATGLSPAADGRPDIAAAAAQWAFTVDEVGATDREALAAAVRFLTRHGEALGGFSSATHLAVAAIRVHDLFGTTSVGDGRDATAADPSVDAVRQRLRS